MADIVCRLPVEVKSPPGNLVLLAMPHRVPKLGQRQSSSMHILRVAVARVVSVIPS
jgi:hypothetical protein